MGIVLEMQTDVIDVIRNDVGGSFDDDTGLYVDGTTQNLQMPAVVSPANNNDLRMDLMHLTEAQRVSGIIKIYTEVPLLNDDMVNSKKADIVVWRGVKYQIQKISDWTQTDLPHYKSYGVKIENVVGDRQL